MPGKNKRYQFVEGCERLGIEKEFLIHCIQSRWVKPIAPELDELDEEDLARTRLIYELKEDFEVNDEAVSIILHLLDQLYYLRNELQGRSDSKAA